MTKGKPLALQDHLQYPLQPVLRRLGHLGDDHAEQIGRLAPGALGHALAIGLDEATDHLVLRDVMDVAVHLVLHGVGAHGSIHDVGVQRVGSYRDLAHLGQLGRLVVMERRPQVSSRCLGVYRQCGRGRSWSRSPRGIVVGAAA